jgi:hypothetical protein
MALADRLGMVAVFLGLLAIAIPILWPDKKWVGWLCLGMAGAFLVYWLFLEIKSWDAIYDLYQKAPVKSTLIVFVGAGLLASALWVLLFRSKPAGAFENSANEKPINGAPLIFMKGYGIKPPNIGWVQLACDAIAPYRREYVVVVAERVTNSLLKNLVFEAFSFSVLSFR